MDYGKTPMLGQSVVILQKWRFQNQSFVLDTIGEDR